MKPKRFAEDGMKRGRVNIDKLIELVKNGAIIKTGVDVYNKNGVLLLERDVPVDQVRTLEVLKENSISELAINPAGKGGLWDASGKAIEISPPAKPAGGGGFEELSSVERRVKEISELKAEATQKYKLAKSNIRKVLFEIRESGGEFDFNSVEETVTDLLSFLSKNDNAFSYLTKELFSYDDYLYNHAINVCTIGTAVLNKFNQLFSASINGYFKASAFGDIGGDADGGFAFFLPDDICDMSIGFFLHDIGKVMIPDRVLNKNGRLTDREFAMVKLHSFEKGMEILDKNHIDNPYIRNTVRLHHAPMFEGENGGYPLDKAPSHIPLYVKICKLADIYDAMTSKRSYKEAFSPIGVVTEIVRSYARKDRMLQFILNAFVQSIGIHPPGSVVFLRSGQLAYVLDSEGPLVIPFTDNSGKPLSRKAEPVRVDKEGPLAIDGRKPLKSPAEVYRTLPAYLQDS